MAMEDIRVTEKRKNIDRKVKFFKILIWIQKNWLKILLFLVVVFLIIFPSLSGNLIGRWLNDFWSAFRHNLTF